MSRDKGYSGEHLALSYLLANGYKLISKNVYFKGGELDLVLLQDRELVIVEVKSRMSGSYENIKYSITDSKIKKLIKGCEKYFDEYSRTGVLLDRWRLDAVFIEYSPGRRSLQHYQDLLVP